MTIADPSRVADIEIVHLTPHPGTRAELGDIRARLLAEYDRRYAGRYDATLTEAEDGEWVDVWRWYSRADAEEALAHIDEIIPAFREWEERVDLRSLSWSRVVPI